GGTRADLQPDRGLPQRPAVGATFPDQHLGDVEQRSAQVAVVVATLGHPPILTVFRICVRFTEHCSDGRNRVVCAAELPSDAAGPGRGPVQPPPDPDLPDVSTAPPPVVRGEPVEVSDGVWVIPDNRVPLVPNVGIVVGDRSALVIDSGLGPRNGAYVLEQASRLAGGRPLYLTVTHFHPEHGFGAQAFKGVAQIIYNAAQRDELHRKGAAYLGMFSGLGANIAAELAGVD